MIRRAAIACACAGCLFPDVGPLTSDAGNAASDAGDAGDAGGPCSDPTVIVGSSNTNGTIDSTPVPYVDSYIATPTVTARVACGWFYVAASPPPSFELGVYSDNASSPSTLLAHATMTNVVTGWNKAPLDTPIEITAKTPVWLGWTPSSGAVSVLLQSNCGAPGLRSDDLVINGALPTTFTVTGSNDTSCMPAAYLGK